MFQAWFNTSFIDQSGLISVNKMMIDKACKVFKIKIIYI